MFLFLPCFGQNRFKVEIILNGKIDARQIQISVDNGKTEYSPTLKIEAKNITVSGDYYGEYAEILVKYPRQNSANLLLLSTFFVDEKPATIEFHSSESEDSLLKNYSLVNAIDFNKEKQKMLKYDDTAKIKLNVFSKEHGSETFTDTSLFRQFLLLDQMVYEKDLKYILDNKHSYYAFSFFRRNFVNVKRLTGDSILSILDEFPTHFKNSVEGDVIRRLVNGWSTVKLDGRAPEFKSRDIAGNLVSLKELTNKGYVLLNFWATWCGPCIEEMPTLKKIYSQYRSKGLEVISIAYPSTLADCKKDIEKYRMDWMNIYNDVDLINSYGGNKPIPRLYLIDKSGKIIYVRDNNAGDDNLGRLRELLHANLYSLF